MKPSCHEPGRPGAGQGLSKRWLGKDQVSDDDDASLVTTETRVSLESRNLGLVAIEVEGMEERDRSKGDEQRVGEDG